MCFAAITAAIVGAAIGALVGIAALAICAASKRN
jgi:hypothetical protein